jgi:hypothetical protein
MRKLLTLLAVAGAAAAIVSISPTAAVSKPQTFSLLGLPERFQPIEGFSETGPPALGARVLITERLRELNGRKSGARVGRSEILCTVIGTWGKSHRSPAYCTAAYMLPAGQILVAGFGPSPVGPEGARVPIVGGTGAYASARGWVKVRDLPGFRTTNEIHLLP